MSETPDAERVVELLRDRQHHLTAHKNVVPDTSQLSASQQSAWVEAMLERDLALMTKVVELMEDNTRSLESYQANKRALKRMRLNSISPQRHYIVTGHL